jgi:hypothetical protein
MLGTGLRRSVLRVDLVLRNLQIRRIRSIDDIRERNNTLGLAIFPAWDCKSPALGALTGPLREPVKNAHRGRNPIGGGNIACGIIRPW